MFRSLTRRLIWLFRRDRIEADMAEEMRFHLDMRAEEKISDGLAPTEAHYAAQRKFGNVALLKEGGRETWGWLWFEGLLQDFRYAARSWRRSPFFTTVAVVSIAFGIGATTAAFSLVNATLLKSLPVKSPDELVSFEWNSGRTAASPQLVEPDVGGPTQAFSQHSFESLRERGGPLIDIFASAGMWAVNVTGDNETEVADLGELVSGNYFRALGVSALLGRVILPKDDVPSAEPVAVISHRYWQKRFGGSMGVIGKVIHVNRLAATIVGVTPPEFVGTNPNGTSEDIFVPLAAAARFRRNPLFAADPVHAWWLRLGGRLHPNASIESVQAHLEPVFQESARDDFRPSLERGPRLRLAPGGKAKSGRARESDERLLTPIMGMAAILLLTACANVAALLLARGASRRREIAVRLALGASRSRLIRQLITENVSLTLFGAAVGMIFAYWNLSLLGMLFPSDLRTWMQSTALDWRVVSFDIGVSLLIGVALGLVPALRATRVNVTAEFQGGSRSLGSQPMSRVSQILVAGQVALCVILLVTSGLFMRTRVNLDRVNLGFNPSNLLLFSIDAYGAGFTPEHFADVHDDICKRIKEVPGVRNVAVSALPWMSLRDAQRGKIELLSSTQPLRTELNIMWNSVGPDFFDTYEIPLVSGRPFTARDNALSPKVAIVNQTMVREHFHDENPVGRRLVLEGEREIVGVVRDAKQTANELRGPTESMVFIPFAQNARGSAFFVVRGQTSSAQLETAVRHAVGAVDPNLAVFMASTQKQRIDGLLLKDTMFAWITSYLGLTALCLAYVGLYGLISYTVVRRTNEIGLRMSLGAQPRDVVYMILRTSLSVVIVGLLIGIPTAFAATHFVSSMLFGLSNNDLLTYSMVAFFVLCVALLACALPAFRAATVDPVVALRSE